MASEFPKRRVKITDIDDVTGGVVDFDAITDAKWLANENVDPGDEAFHRRLHGKTNDDRSDTERSQCWVPVDEDYGYDNKRDNERRD